MAFLDKSTLIVDAVLTDKGRQKLASNNFSISKFALGDDEIDYSLYDESNSQGPNYYGIAIENMPILEAFTRADSVMRYKLHTQEVGDNQIPQVQGLQGEYIFNADANNEQVIVLSPSTSNNNGQAEEYIFELQDSQYVDLVIGDATTQNQVSLFPISIIQSDLENVELPFNKTSNITLDGLAVTRPRFDGEVPIADYAVRINAPAANAMVTFMGIQKFGAVQLITPNGTVESITATGQFPVDFIMRVNGSGGVRAVYAENETAPPTGPPGMPPLGPGGSLETGIGGK